MAVQSLNRNPLKVALAGAGMISWFHLTGWRNLGERVRLVAVCDPDGAKAARRAQEFSIPNVYRDADAMFAAEAIDALDVATPRATHAGWVDAAAARGIHVLCQKPLTPTLAESEALVRRVAGKSRLMAHENWRFRPWYRELKQWIVAGELGELVLARMATLCSGLLPDANGRRPLLEREPYTQHEERLMIAEVLIHHLDVMRFLCGDLRVVAARGARTVSDVVGETVAAIFLETASGAPIEVTGALAAAGHPPRAPDRLEVVGTRASATFADTELRLHGANPRSQRYDPEAGYQASFDGVIAHFVTCLETGVPFETDALENLETLRLVEHAYWSAGLDRARGGAQWSPAMDTRIESSSSLIGQAKFALDTPALLVDLDIMEANIARIVATCRAHRVGWRPHSKAHKMPEIARLQIAAGAIGITCAKLGEAEVMAGAGMRDILIANQIVGATKISRLVLLADHADPIVCADSVRNLVELDAAFRASGKQLRVAIEVNIGMNRAGVEPGAPVVAFAKEIADCSGLRFVGVVGWESQATTIADPTEKERTVRDAIAALTLSARACRAAGLDVDIVSCGGTGTFPYCVQQPGVSEVQVGGGIFGDMHYLTHYHVDFAPALTLLTTVTSRPTPTRIVIDAGKKSMSGDAAMPEPRGLPPMSAMKLSAEHSKIELEQPSADPRIGDKIELIVGYSDTTVHLHEEIAGIRAGRIESLWRVAGRGKLK